MKFTHEIISFEELTATSTSSGRLYETPRGSYPSITTILGKQPDKQKGLQKWRDRIGHEKADRIANTAARRGTNIHEHLELYLMTEKMPLNEMPTTMAMFSQMKQVIDKNLEIINASEAPMYSDALRVAGRCDLIGIWKGERAIIDFKTSSREKQRKYITDYFLQCTAYSMMFEERTQLPCKNIVVIIGCDETPMAQVFEAKRDDYVDEVKRIINDYHA